MILIDDDEDDSIRIIESKTTEIITNENGADCLIPKKPTICTFFKPKTKNNKNLFANGTKQNSGTFEKVELSKCYNFVNEYYDDKFLKTQADSRQIPSINTNFNPNLTKFDTIKQESFAKCERDVQRSFSPTESSSLSNLPTISATYSKSTRSLSDSDNQDPLDISTNSLIVKNVYSLCKKKKPSISTRNSNCSDKSMPLNTCIKSCDNSIIILRKPVPAIKTLPKISPTKTSNKPKTKSSKKINLKATEETLQRINDVFKLVKQQANTKTGNRSINDINDTQSESSDALTEAMREDVNDFDLEPINNHQSKYSLMQPIILLEPLQIDKVSPLKRKKNNSCRNSSEPFEKKLKLNRSLESKDSKLVTSDNVNAKKIDDASKTKEKALLSPDNLSNSRNNSLHNKVIYHSMRDSVENDIIYCFVCKKSGRNICTSHPVTWIPNQNIDCPYVEYSIDESFEKYLNSHSEKELCNCNQNELDHIQNSLPKLFHLKESGNSEIGVWTKQKFKQGSIVGPYLGEIVENWKSKKSIRGPYKTRRLLKSGTFDELHCLEFAFKSNWLRCVNFTDEDALANLKVLRYDGKIFLQSTKEINANTELLVCNKGDFKIFKLKKKLSELSTSGSGPVDLDDRKNVSISDKMIISSQDKTVKGGNVKNLSYQDHQYTKAIIEEITQVWESDSPKTVSEALTILEVEYPEVKEINVKSFATLFSRLQSRHRDTFLSNVDKEIIDNISGLLMRDPSLTCTQINKIFCEKFPHKQEFSTLRINQIITLLNLRPLKGIDDNVDREAARKIVHMFTYNKCLKLEEAQKHLSIRFPMKPILSLETIDKIVKLNYCQISDEEDVFRVDQDVLKEINKLISDGQKSKEIVYEKIKKKFPHKEIITLPYFEFLIKKYNLLEKHSAVVKCDEEMKTTICKLYQDHPEFSASKINEQLRNLLPNKPLLSRHTISNKIRQFRSTNKL